MGLLNLVKWGTEYKIKVNVSFVKWYLNAIFALEPFRSQTLLRYDNRTFCFR